MSQKKTIIIGVVIIVVLIAIGTFAKVSFGQALHYSVDSHRGHPEATSTATSTFPSDVAGQNATSTENNDSEKVDCDKLKCIALTFDDGPSKYTPKLLDILEKKNVTATFFVWGGKYAGKADLQREAKDGMEIGNHTWHHNDLTTLSVASTTWEITKTANSIEKATGKRPTLMRPPYGKTNQQVQDISKKLGEAVILWNIDPEDWRFQNPEHLVDFFHTHAREGGIVDMHSRKATVEGIAKVIDELRKQGFTFVTVTQLIGEENLKPGVVYTSRKGERT